MERPRTCGAAQCSARANKRRTYARAVGRAQNRAPWWQCVKRQQDSLATLKLTPLGPCNPRDVPPIGTLVAGCPRHGLRPVGTHAVVDAARWVQVTEAGPGR